MPDPERVYAGYRASRRKRRAWDAQNAGNVAIRAELAAAALEAVPPEGDLLDAGCGAGWWLARLREAGVPAGRLHGIDALEDRVRAATETGADVRVADVRALPYPDGAFAAVFLFTVLSSLGSRAEVAAAVREARRVLAPDGAVVVWEPRVPNPLNRHTRLIRARDLGPVVAGRTLTVLPSLARRAPRLYDRLAAVPLLRTHRLYVLAR